MYFINPTRRETCANAHMLIRRNNNNNNYHTVFTLFTILTAQSLMKWMVNSAEYHGGHCVVVLCVPVKLTHSGKKWWQCLTTKHPAGFGWTNEWMIISHHNDVLISAESRLWMVMFGHRLWWVEDVFQSIFGLFVPCFNSFPENTRWENCLYHRFLNENPCTPNKYWNIVIL